MSSLDKTTRGQEAPLQGNKYLIPIQFPQHRFDRFICQHEAHVRTALSACTVTLSRLAAGSARIDDPIARAPESYRFDGGLLMDDGIELGFIDPVTGNRLIGTPAIVRSRAA